MQISINLLNPTILIVGGFLVITLIIGIWASRKIKSLNDYALGGKNFNTTTLTLTLLATYIGGAQLETINKIYRSGIIISVASLGIIFQHLFFAYIIAPKIIYFKNCITIGDLMEKLYGKKIKFITGAIITFFSLFTIGSQFFMIGKIFNILLDIKTIYGIIIGGSILILYSTIGGIKAVAITDIFQFLIIVIVIPFIASFLLNSA
ncbi:MAG: hypothetical protein GY830_07170 [Bacteroidetes bacterium]|nr:hypothetical protein [Bacteroidota bacterium]